VSLVEIGIVGAALVTFFVIGLVLGMLVVLARGRPGQRD
jgi:hypothetical protein